MDILDILLDNLLKPPQPLMGLFFVSKRNTDKLKTTFLCKLVCKENQSERNHLCKNHKPVAETKNNFDFD